MTLSIIPGAAPLCAAARTATALAAGASPFAAAPSQVFVACRRTIDRLLARPDASAMPALNRHAFLALREEVAAAPENPGEAARLAVMTVGLLDALILDEMAPNRARSDLWNFYAREHGYAKKLVLTVEEGAGAIRSLEEQGWRGVDRIESIPHICSRRFVLDPWHLLEREGELLRQLADAAYAFLPLTHVCIPFRCGEAAILGCYELQQEEGGGRGPVRFSWRETSAGAELPPQSPLPRQEYWRALLHSGIALFSDTELAVTPPPAIAERDSGALLRRLIDAPTNAHLDPWRRGALRRLAVHARAVEDPARLELFAAGHARHYARLLRQGRQEPDVMLTRSGVSANEIAIAAVARILGRDASAWAHPGWYYENRASLVTHFTRAQQADARALFVSLLSTVPDRLLALDRTEEAGVPLSAREAARLFLQGARRRPAERHCLVIDKTAHLLWSPAEWGEAIPENVTLLETASLTKQQRGGRNYFFGLLAHHGPRGDFQIVEEEAREQFGSLTPFGVVNLPRLTPSEILATQEVFRKANEAFALGFEMLQEGVPEGIRWSVERHGAFSYLLPPVERLLAEARREHAGGMADRTLLVRDASRPTVFYRFREETPLVALLPEDLARLREIGVAFGDSFGLQESRLTVIRYLLRNAVSATDSQRASLVEVYAPRIAPGSAVRPEELWHQGATLGEFIAGRMRIMQDAERERRSGDASPR